MSRKVLLYSFMVWLTSVLVTPILVVLTAMIYWYFAWYLRYSHEVGAPGHYIDPPSLKDVFYFYVFGFVLAIPIFLLFWLGSFFICHRIWPIRGRKLALAGWALLLVGAPSIIMSVRESLEWKVPLIFGAGYCLTMLGGIFFYRFPEPVVAEFEFD
jgi:hypothetical protein